MKMTTSSTFTSLLQDAYQKKYAVPALNAWTYQDALMIVAAAEKAQSPVIIQTSGTCIDHNGLEFSFHMVKNAAKRATVPVIIHYDHAQDFNLIEQAIGLGYDSVMYDGSSLSMEENVQNTRLVKKMADRAGVFVEAEIGHVMKGEGDQEILTSPEEACAFVEAVKVDALAVAVGTRHAMQKRETPLNFEALDKLTAAVSTPLVLHGSSGVRDSDYSLLITSAICKVNIATRLRMVFLQEIRSLSNTFVGSDHIAFIMQAHQATEKEAIKVMQLLSSAGKV